MRLWENLDGFGNKAALGILVIIAPIAVPVIIAICIILAPAYVLGWAAMKLFPGLKEF